MKLIWIRAGSAASPHWGVANVLQHYVLFLNFVIFFVLHDPMTMYLANLQESSVEVPKNPPKPVLNYRSSYKKGSGPSYGKPSFPATENIPIPPMGVHVASANVFNVDQSRKIAGMNNFFPGPHQVPTNSPFYHHRGEGLAPFPHNSVPPYGKGHPGWQHHGRGYSDASYKHSGFLPRYDQQHIGPRNMHPPMAPFMNINVAQYNYPNFPGKLSLLFLLVSLLNAIDI